MGGTRNDYYISGQFYYLVEFLNATSVPFYYDDLKIGDVLLGDYGFF